MDNSKHNRPAFDDYYGGFWGGRAFRVLDHAKIRTLGRVFRDLPDGASILDLGCGSAGISARMCCQFPQFEFLGADSDLNLLKMAEAAGLTTRQVDFDESLPFADGEFDVVMMIDTIEHVKSRSSALCEVARILKKDGVLVVFTPPYDTIAWNVGEKVHRLLTRRMADHISPFTYESLTWSLAEIFNDVNVFNMNFGLTMCGIGRRKKREYAGE